MKEWIFILLFIILFSVVTGVYFNFNSTLREGYITNLSQTWTSDTVTQLTNYYATLNGGTPASATQLVAMYQELGVAENDATAFMQNGLWNWDLGLVNAFTTYAMNNPNLFQGTGNIAADQIDQIQKMYPQEYYEYILSSGTADTLNTLAKQNKMKCNVDASGNVSGDGFYLLDNSGNMTSTLVQNKEVPSMIPGFNFLGENPCNPCIINSWGPDRYSCPFSLPDSGKKPLMPNAMMQYVWGMIVDSSTNSIDVSSLLPTSTTNSNSNSISTVGAPLQ